MPHGGSFSSGGASEPLSPAPEAFAHYLARLEDGEAVDFDAFCAERPDLAPELRGLHAAWAEVDAGWKAASGGAPESVDDLLVGRRVGAYLILRRLGAGGMGLVYEARQESPRRHVALKLLRPGWSSPRSLRRFEREVELLGRLRHPAVAQIHEAGTVEIAGLRQPFFAMELVEGRSITRYAAEAGIRRGARIDLFARVCDGVQHAHQQGVVHRDLKPENVLVDATGAPKILDFGVGRATDAALALTLRTAPGEIVGTLAYMSPEQAGGGGVDTRSDVYALGVMLYELLAGRLPHEVSGLSLAQAVRAIQEDQPPLLGLLDRALKGDLETIAAKALAKEPERRYASAAELAADLRRHLANEPIAARPATAAYQARQFARRHRAAVAGGVLVLLALVAGTVAATLLYLRAERERREALAVALFMEETLRGVAPAVALGRDTTMLREMLDRGAERIEQGQLAAAPKAEARLRMTIGSVYDEIAADAEAKRMLVPAVALTERLYGRESAEHARAVFLAARSLAGHEDALALRRRLFPGDHPDVAQSLHAVGVVLRGQGRFSEAGAKLEEALAMRRRFHRGEDHETIAATLNALAFCQGTPAEGLEYVEQALEMHRRLHPGDHPDVAQSLRDAAYALEALGRSEDALVAGEEALQMRRRLYPADHHAVIDSLLGLVECYGSLERYDDALRAAEENLALTRRLYGADHAMVGTALTYLAEVLQSQGRSAEALSYFEEGLAIRQRHRAPKHYQISQSLHGLGTCLVSLGRAEEALPLIEEAMAIRQADALRNDRPADELIVSGYRCGLATALCALGRYEEAEALLARSWENLREAQFRRLVLRSCIQAHVRLYEAWHAAEPDHGHDVEAAAWRERLACLPGTT